MILSLAKQRFLPIIAYSGLTEDSHLVWALQKDYIFLVDAEDLTVTAGAVSVLAEPSY